MLTLSTALLYCLCFASLVNSTSPFSSLRHNEIRELRQHLKPGTFVLGVRVDSVTDMKKVAQMQHSQAKGGQKKAQAQHRRAAGLQKIDNTFDSQEYPWSPKLEKCALTQ